MVLYGIVTDFNDKARRGGDVPRAVDKPLLTCPEGGGGDTCKQIKGIKSWHAQVEHVRGLPRAEAAYCTWSAWLSERGCDDQPAPDPACCFDCPADPAPAEQ